MSDLVNVFLNEAIEDLILEMFKETELDDEEYNSFKEKMLKEIVLQDLVDRVINLSE